MKPIPFIMKRKHLSHSLALSLSLSPCALLYTFVCCLVQNRLLVKTAKLITMPIPMPMQCIAMRYSAAQSKVQMSKLKTSVGAVDFGVRECR